MGEVFGKGARFLCETDADYLLGAVFLNDGKICYNYAKKDGNKINQYVCNDGKVFGSYNYSSLSKPRFDELFTAQTVSWSASDKNGFFEWSECGTKRKDISMRALAADLECICDKISELDEEEKASADDQIEEYNEDSRVLKVGREGKEYFVTEGKRYGPYYEIIKTAYLDDSHFQFSYTKKKDSRVWFYNLNGEEKWMFGRDPNASDSLKYDKKGRAIVEHFWDQKYILIDGQKIDFFGGRCHDCRIEEKGGQEIIVGMEKTFAHRFICGGVEHPFSVRNVFLLNDGSLVYCQIEGDTETWFCDYKPISVCVYGEDSSIVNDAVTYKRRIGKQTRVPYFTVDGMERNGFAVEKPQKGFVYLDGCSLYFAPYDFACLSDYKLNGSGIKKYCDAHDENLIRIARGGILAGDTRRPYDKKN